MRRKLKGMPINKNTLEQKQIHGKNTGKKGKISLTLIYNEVNSTSNYFNFTFSYFFLQSQREFGF